MTLLEQQWIKAFRQLGGGSAVLNMPTRKEFYELMHKREMLDIHNAQGLQDDLDKKNRKYAELVQQRKDDYKWFIK